MTYLPREQHLVTISAEYLFMLKRRSRSSQS